MQCYTKIFYRERVKHLKIGGNNLNGSQLTPYLTFSIDISCVQEVGILHNVFVKIKNFFFIFSG